MKVEITRFKVKKGKSETVNEWMSFLNEHLKEIELTLIDEKMYVETIFREELAGEEYLYWYSVQGEGGIYVGDSSHEVDKKHLEYWKECIDPEFKPVNLTTEVIMIQDKFLKQMKD